MLKIVVFALLNILLIQSVPVPPGLTDAEFDELMNTGDMGDIHLTPDDLTRMKGISGRVGLTNENMRWPNGVIPFVISSAFNANQQNMIRNGMREIESRTCIRFVQRTNQANFVNIINGNGCSAFVGRVGGAQTLSLRIPNCIHHPTIVHEFLHAVGLWHMHQYEDRYSHVIINWNNIIQGEQHNFNRLARNFAHNFGTRYDYHSIMHYRANEFSRNGWDTITTRNAAMQNVIGRVTTMSNGDIQRVRNMYRC